MLRRELRGRTLSLSAAAPTPRWTIVRHVEDATTSAGGLVSRVVSHSRSGCNNGAMRVRAARRWLRKKLHARERHGSIQYLLTTLEKPPMLFARSEATASRLGICRRCVCGRWRHHWATAGSASDATRDMPGASPTQLVDDQCKEDAD